MALKKNMTGNEMINFIDYELLPQTKQEIQSLIQPTKQQGGYFVVTRQILCMVDFLGAIFAGYSRKDRKGDKKGKNIATSKKAKLFINIFFEPKTAYQPKVINQLYDMYRHGLVHLYQPKFIKLSNRKVLKWFFYNGKSHYKWKTMYSNQGKQIYANVDHLKIICGDPNRKTYHLPICIDALYEDFENTVQRYKGKLKYIKYQTRWETAVNAICKPRELQYSNST